MLKLYCPYCGKPLDEGCDCENEHRLEEENNETNIYMFQKDEDQYFEMMERKRIAWYA